MLQFRNYLFKKSTVLPILVIAIFVYIYLNFFTYQEQTVFILTDSSETTNIIEYNTKESISRDRMKGILSLKKQIKKINKKQRVQNMHFGGEITLVIVIQVHDQKYYLEQLIDSLKQATGIAKTLLIFSHSYCEDDINLLIRNISFAKVMQIYYPYSVQLHPLVFPGDDNKVCDDLIFCRKGDRKPLGMQAKHHWWWKAEYVFNEIRFIKHYNASVLFLDEDQYVTKDFIFILKVLERLATTRYPNCEVITLGGNRRNVSDYNQQHGSVTVKPWSSSDSGVVLNRFVWKTMRSLSEHYCRFKDSRWINSLTYLARQSTADNFLVLSIDSPRVLRFSDCINSNGNSCHMVESVEKVKGFVNRIGKGLYPQNLVVREIFDQGKIASNGEWHDARDQELCLFYTSNLKKSPLMIGI